MHIMSYEKEAFIAEPLIRIAATLEIRNESRVLDPRGKYRNYLKIIDSARECPKLVRLRLLDALQLPTKIGECTLRITVDIFVKIAQSHRVSRACKLNDSILR